MSTVLTDNRITYNASIERLRTYEFPQLAESTYLDHAASTLYPKSLVDGFASDMVAGLFGNPHSESRASQLASSRIDNARLRALGFFGAHPDNYDLVFVSNATAGIKLVADAFRASPHGFRFAYHQDSHTSVVGVREESQQSICLSTPGVLDWLDGNPPVFEEVAGPDNGRDDMSLLFAYPAQSNMCGRQHALSWAHGVRMDDTTRTYTLVDAAAFAATSPLDLGDSNNAPDFTVISFAKLFGFPDLAALIVRREATEVFTWRKYFGGGTVDMVACLQEQWHAPKLHLLHERLEDGTLPIHNIIALDTAFDVHARLYGGMADVAAHTRFLASRLYCGLSRLRHWNGNQVCIFYSQDPGQPTGSQSNGPLVTFNVVSDTEGYISPTEFEKLASVKRIDIRTGGLCNPGGIAAALKLQPWELHRNFSAGIRCGQENDLMGGKPAGVIRASVGAMSTLSDVDAFISFVDQFFRCRGLGQVTIQPPPTNPTTPNDTNSLFSVNDIYIYPIKSCGGFRVPRGTAWDIRQEGLVWDREWVLIHQGNSQALSQKRYPLMALLRPSIDQCMGVLRVRFVGNPRLSRQEIAIPLSDNPMLFKPTTDKSRLSRVCGDEIQAMVYNSGDIHDFFSAALGVPCELARFPSGGVGVHCRLSKARIQKHQREYSSHMEHVLPSDFSREHRILLTNESAILLVNTASVDAINNDIRNMGNNREVPAASFRPNIVVGPCAKTDNSTAQHGSAYVEDHWTSINIGQVRYTMAGSCRRCQMVCVDQITGEKHEEPLATLSKTRRLDGKVFFGVYMCLLETQSRFPKHPQIQVGDSVRVE